MEARVFNFDPSKRIVTKCEECVFYLNISSDPKWQRTPHYRFCKASPLPRKLDLEDGKIKAFKSNGGVDTFLFDHSIPYRNCGEVNHGHCPKFQPLNLSKMADSDSSRPWRKICLQCPRVVNIADARGKCEAPRPAKI